MKLIYFATAAALLIASPSLAAGPTTTTDVPAQSISSPTTFLGYLTAGFYNFTLQYELRGSTTYGSFIADIVKTGTTKVVASVSDMKLLQDPAEVKTGSKTSGDYWLTGGEYSVAWKNTSLGGKSTASVTANSVAAVPGPEAGAGVGALALLGAAYWAKRRRDEKVCA